MYVSAIFEPDRIRLWPCLLAFPLPGHDLLQCLRIIFLPHATDIVGMVAAIALPYFFFQCLLHYLIFAASMCMTMQHICTILKSWKKGNPVVAQDHFNWVSMKTVFYCLDITYTFKTGFVYFGTFVVIAPDKVDI